MATILLTSISFRSTITSKLPLTSYLTLIDKYSITLIVFDLFCTLYHAIIGYWMNNDKSVDSKLKSHLPDQIMSSFYYHYLFYLI
ncbi:unnamed protein product [Rotaria magnacalcarata]|uniref:Uncharacterized protein n=2 Tax=Rotaria magnacalcarata TaxID=392030 RepID=A0A820UD64_9BILA|nr:unnamed protein product [Rotaria magnacalcarata]CAF2112388.1 unnamed protein product [Rotaria magnacalcarata]CAF4479734.1 unnamed protein product [Rotaria magnacalcarata]CAF5175701.1 unnamed protein product [Rotaria magnacalcarata]